MDFNQSPEQIMRDVRKRLTDTKGDWPEIVKITGVPYHTLAKLHQGVTKNPRLATITPLVQAFTRHDATGSLALPKSRKRPPAIAVAQVSGGA